MPSYKRLLTASAKGGVGKSTTAAGLAASFASCGKSVLLLDLDCTGRCLDILTGCSSAVFDFADVIMGTEVSTAAAKTSIEGVSLIAACTYERLEDVSKNIGTDCRSAVRKGLESVFSQCACDIVIADTGGGISLAEAAADMFELVLVTSEQSRTSVRAAEYAAQRLNQSGAEAIRLVICSFDLAAVKRENRAGVIEMIDTSSLACVGVVPFDRKLQKAQDAGTVPPKNSMSAKAYGNIARRISGYDVPLFDGIRELRRKRNAAL